MYVGTLLPFPPQGPARPCPNSNAPCVRRKTDVPVSDKATYPLFQNEKSRRECRECGVDSQGGSSVPVDRLLSWDTQRVPLDLRDRRHCHSSKMGLQKARVNHSRVSDRTNSAYTTLSRPRKYIQPSAWNMTQSYIWCRWLTCAMDIRWTCQSPLPLVAHRSPARSNLHITSLLVSEGNTSAKAHHSQKTLKSS